MPLDDLPKPRMIPPAVEPPEPPEAPLPYFHALWKLLDNPIEAWLPSLPLMSRMCAEDTQAGGHPVKKGTFIFVPIYAIHRHRRLWRDPDAFDPDRFGPEESAGRHRFAYLPFGAGPRVCIGQTFALTEAVAILATLVRGATLEPDPGHRIRPVMRVSMRPQGGMPMTLRLR